MSYDLTGKSVHNLQLFLSDTTSVNAPSNIVLAKKGEQNARFIYVTMFDHRNKINFADTEAKLWWKDLEGESYSSDCIITEDGDILVRLGSTITKEARRVPCEIRIEGELKYEDGTSYGEGSILISPTFFLIVQETSYDVNAISADELEE